MKKEINSKSKRKWVAGGLAAFASIALLTTGFATWVVGRTQTEADTEIGVTVDTAKNVNVEFIAELQSGESIRLAEASNSASDSKDFVKADGTPNGDLKITFTTLKISFGVESGFSVTGKKLKFSITDNIKVPAPSPDIFGREGTDLTYIEAPEAIDVETNSESTTNNGVTTYTFSKLTFDFKWGTFFGTEGQSPLQFYNSKFNANSSLKTSANAQKVVDELNGMRDAYAGPKDKIKLHLVIEA